MNGGLVSGAGATHRLQGSLDFGEPETMLTLPVPGLRDIVSRNLPDPHEVIHRGLGDAEHLHNAPDGDHIFLFHAATLAHSNPLAAWYARW